MPPLSSQGNVVPTVASMTDEEFKETIVRSYNRCAAEHKRYKRALEWIASEADDRLSAEGARLVARQALDDA